MLEKLTVLERGLRELIRRCKELEFENQKLKLTIESMEKENKFAKASIKKLEMYENEKKLLKEKIIRIINKISHNNI